MQRGREFNSGWLGGAAGVLVSHPLDTIRVQVQVCAHGNTGIMQSARTTFAREGAAGFVKGIASPLVCVGIWKSSIFGVQAKALQHFQRVGWGRSKSSHLPSLKQQATAAAMGAMVGGVVITPVEMVKCNAQTTAEPGLQQELLIARKVIARNGVQGLFRGCWLVCLGGLVSMPVWFCGNDLLLQWRARQLGLSSREDVSFADKIVCGAVAGTISWVPAYPLDKMKTQWVTNSSSTLSFSSMVRVAIAQQGLYKYCFGGLGATCLRSLTQCGATMAVYDWGMRTL